MKNESYRWFCFVSSFQKNFDHQQLKILFSASHFLVPTGRPIGPVPIIFTQKLVSLITPKIQNFAHFLVEQFLSFWKNIVMSGQVTDLWRHQLTLKANFALLKSSRLNQSATRLLEKLDFISAHHSKAHGIKNRHADHNFEVRSIMRQPEVTNLHHYQIHFIYIFEQKDTAAFLLLHHTGLLMVWNMTLTGHYLNLTRGHWSQVRVTANTRSSRYLRRPWRISFDS